MTEWITSSWLKFPISCYFISNTLFCIRGILSCQQTVYSLTLICIILLIDSRLYVNADELMYWVTIKSQAVKMAALNGTGRVTTLLNESESEPKTDYSGITLYNNYLYISDESRRSVSATTIILLAHTLMTLLSVITRFVPSWFCQSNVDKVLTDKRRMDKHTN